MKYELINPPIAKGVDLLQQILYNRGIPLNEQSHYLCTTDDDINSYAGLGVEKLEIAAIALGRTIAKQENAIIIVDSDCDGYTSSALLINFLYKNFPAWVEQHLSWKLHTGKQHGLDDCLLELINSQYNLIITPDSSSNDLQEHKSLYEANKNIIVLDHHEADDAYQDDYSIIINNQLSEYPNKFFSGVGITWQFCRFFEDYFDLSPCADVFLDLVALGNCGDMMSLLSLETKHIINKGFQEQNIENPFLAYMADKNSYSLNNKITSMGAAFYIVPFINAIVRSGTQQEKELIFESLLNHKAYLKILSNKRGHKLNEEEEIVQQAIRTAINVKARQTKLQDAAMELLHNMIIDEDLLNHKVLLFLLNKDNIDKNIAGLCANKIMGEYKRPCCILLKTIVENEVIYQGSARGCSAVGVTQFKDICVKSQCIEYAEGHQGAFGLGIKEQNINDFISKTDYLLQDMSNESIYKVDFIYNDIFSPTIAVDVISVARYDNLWGQDIEEPLIAVEKVKVTSDNLKLLGLAKNKPTLSIKINDDISFIKFGSSQQEYDSLQTEGYIELTIIGKCSINDWGGQEKAQIQIIDYMITGSNEFYF